MYLCLENAPVQYCLKISSGLKITTVIEPAVELERHADIQILLGKERIKIGAEHSWPEILIWVCMKRSPNKDGRCLLVETIFDVINIRDSGMIMIAVTYVEFSVVLSYLIFMTTPWSRCYNFVFLNPFLNILNG